MQPRTESSSGLEARLAKTLLADLIEREANDYASIEIVREPSELAKTIRFRRKPVDSLTTRFAHVGLRSTAADERGTVPYEKHSEPYERVEIQPDSPPEPEVGDSIPFLQIDVWESGELVASSNLVAIDDPEDTLVDLEVQTTAPIERAAPRSWFRPLVVISFLAAAFAVGLGVPFLL
jgi:hypothetical protein